MVELEEVGEREVLLQALKGYLEELRDSGVDELNFAEPAPSTGGCSATGDPRARLLLVMSGAGFAGEAGALLLKIIEAMGFNAETAQLLSFSVDASGAASATREELLSRIAAVAPAAVVALGDAAAQLLLQSREPVATLRGSFHDLAGIPLMPSLHPEALLKNPALKREVWDDMKQVMSLLAARPS
jgi:uracil-DNA glycosylase